jgi:hypothetical protein
MDSDSSEYDSEDEIYKELGNNNLLEEIERFNDRYYIGTCRHYINEGLLLDLCIIPKIFYKYSYDEFSKSLNSSIEIMKLQINNDVYNIILKTHWIRLIQRVWKKIFFQRNIVIKKRMSIKCQKHFECNGRYSNDAVFMPTIYGMLSKLNKYKV